MANARAPGLSGAGLDALRASFARRYGRQPTLLAEAGGRVNLIGEHTDYHEGYVLPAAIDLRTVTLGAPRDDGVLSVWSETVGADHRFRVDELQPAAADTPIDWRTYAAAPLWALGRRLERPGGADVLVASDVPLGGGLSSSASLQVALAGLGAALAGATLSPLELARVAHEAERDFCGVPCGMMDQLASACGAPGRALLIDCRAVIDGRDGAITEVAFPDDLALVVADSGVRHSVAGGEYALRQRQCGEALERLRDAGLALAAARDLTAEALEAERPRLDEVGYRRLRHVVSENRRVLEARRALERGDAAVLGGLLCRSHESLAGDYEVSCAELDQLVEAALAVPGVHGARLTGAGFGGNTVNLVDGDRAEATAGAIVERYAAATGRRTAARVVRPSAGVSVRPIG